jgi:hypothetical protein
MAKLLLPTDRPRHSVIIRDQLQLNGIVINNDAYYIQSGTLSSVVGSNTGSVTLHFDAYGLKLKRFEAFHSGAATTWDCSLETETPNTGAFFDPRNTVVNYNTIAGSDSYTAGVDQIEDIVAVTDVSGNLYIKFKPYGAGNNSFKYLLFFEAAYVYVEGR